MSGSKGTKIIHAGTQMIAYDKFCNAAVELEGADVGADPVGDALRERRLGVCIAAGALCGDKDLGVVDFPVIGSVRGRVGPA